MWDVSEKGLQIGRSAVGTHCFEDIRSRALCQPRKMLKLANSVVEERGRLDVSAAGWET
jgi:hypothetical protein